MENIFPSSDFMKIDCCFPPSLLSVFIVKDSCVQKNFKFRITRQFLKSELLHKVSGFITTDSRLKMLIIVVPMHGVEGLM